MFCFYVCVLAGESRAPCRAGGKRGDSSCASSVVFLFEYDFFFFFFVYVVVLDVVCFVWVVLLFWLIRSIFGGTVALALSFRLAWICFFR